MDDFSYVQGFIINASASFAPLGFFGGTITDVGDDDTFNTTPADQDGGGSFYVGTVNMGGITMPVFTDTGTVTASSYDVYNPGPNMVSSLFSSMGPGDITVQDFSFCFGPGTRITTPDGAVAVETLQIGDDVVTADGRIVAVKWIGRQTAFPTLAGPKMRPVMICEGALGSGLPKRYLIVTADHGMILDGLVINAGALVNDSTIRVMTAAELPQQITYYHIETEDHDVILAEGAAAETFIDYADRAAFDNHAEYLALYGVERIIPEMPRARISSARMLPPVLRQRFGISGAKAA